MMSEESDNPFAKAAPADDASSDGGGGDAGADKPPSWAAGADAEDEERGLLGKEGDDDRPAADRAAEAAPAGPACACLTVSYYQPFFDIDSADVGVRLLRSVWPPMASSFWENVGGKPDLYGPFWSCTTLIFVMAAASNFTSWLTFDSGMTGTEWMYDFSLLTFACSVVYGFWVGAASLVWFAMRTLGVPHGLVQLLCLYGYSTVVFIPVAVVCSTVLVTLDWIAVAVGLLVSMSFVGVNTYPAIKAANLGSNSGLVLLGGMAVLHTGFALMLKLYWFSK